MESRHILYLDPVSSTDASPDLVVENVLPAITSAGWLVHVAGDAYSANGFMREHPFGVGITRLGPSSDRLFLQDMDALFRRADKTVAWVALLHPEARADDDVRRLILDAFYDYHTLPPDIDRLLTTLGHAYGMAMIASAVPKPAVDHVDEPQMVGVSEPMQEVFQSIRKVSAVDAPVLISGESGTGKELAAQAIHERSKCASGPFVPVNCAALPPSLIQSELFGHEKGAFTGAQRRKIGCIESANGGTLFLDEIGDLLPELQVNLLRFLQGSAIQRVGSPKEIPVQVRVIVATNVDLEKAVREGRFREDLYFRINVLRLDMPPLRSRGEDIQVLAQFFFEQFSREGHRNLAGFSRQALERIAEHPWPGNVRELINRVRRAIVMCDDRWIKPKDLGLRARPAQMHLKTLEEVRAVAETDAILLALETTDANLSRAARALGISRPRLYRLMEKYGLTP